MAVYTLRDKSLFLHKILDRQPSLKIVPSAYTFDDGSFEEVAKSLTQYMDEEDMWSESAGDMEDFVATVFPDNLVTVERYEEGGFPHVFIEIAGPDVYFTLDIVHDPEAETDEDDDDV